MAENDSWWSDVGGWYKDNKDWINPVIQAGFSLYGAGQKQNNQSAFVDYLKAKEKENYENTLRQQQYQLALAAARGGGGGGGGGSGGGGGISPAQLRQMQALYKPFADSAQVMLPQMQTQYLAGLEALGKMQSLYGTPQMTAQVAEAPRKPMEQSLNLPGYLYK